MAIEVQLADPPVAWELPGPAELLDAAEDLAARGWRGELSFCHSVVGGVPSGALEWSLELNPESGIGQPVKAGIGDFLLLSGGVLRSLSAAEFAAVTA